MVAYELGIHGIDVGALDRHPGARASSSAPSTVPDGPDGGRKLTDPRFRQVARSGRWRVWTAPRADARGRDCPAAGPDAPRVAPTAT